MDFTLLNFHFISRNLETLAASAGRNFGDFSRLMKLSISTSFLTVMRSGLPSGVSTSQVTISLYKHVPTILAPRSQVPNHPRWWAQCCNSLVILRHFFDLHWRGAFHLLCRRSSQSWDLSDCHLWRVAAINEATLLNGTWCSTCFECVSRWKRGGDHSNAWWDRPKSTKKK